MTEEKEAITLEDVQLSIIDTSLKVQTAEGITFTLIRAVQHMKADYKTHELEYIENVLHHLETMLSGIDEDMNVLVGEIDGDDYKSDNA